LQFSARRSRKTKASSKKGSVSGATKNLSAPIRCIEHAIDAELSTSILMKPIDGQIGFKNK